MERKEKKKDRERLRWEKWKEILHTILGDLLIMKMKAKGFVSYAEVFNEGDIFFLNENGRIMHFTVLLQWPFNAIVARRPQGHKAEGPFSFLYDLKQRDYI